MSCCGHGVAGVWSCRLCRLPSSSFDVSVVPAEPVVRLGNKIAVELGLHLPAQAALVASHQKDRLPTRVECEGDTPNTLIGIEPQLLHVRIPRSVQRIHCRTSKCRADSLKDLCGLQQRVLNLLSHRSEFGFELGMEQDRPRHA